MATQKKLRSAQGVGTLGKHYNKPQGPPEHLLMHGPELMLLTSLRFNSSDHIAKYNCLSSRVIVATRYYGEELSNQLRLLNDIWWLFVRGQIRQFIET